MRTATFNLIGTLICGVILFSIYVTAAYFEVRFPRTDIYLVDIVIEQIEGKFAELITAIFALPVLILVLNPLNKKLRQWRKLNGRDIEEEEKFETDSGILTLTEKTKWK